MRMILRSVLPLTLAWIFSSTCFAGDPSQVPKTSPPQTSPGANVSENSGSPVEVDGKPIFLVYAPVAGISRDERAVKIEPGLSPRRKTGDCKST
jgi:hypothetical protein